MQGGYLDVLQFISHGYRKSKKPTNKILNEIDLVMHKLLTLGSNLAWIMSLFP